MEENELWNVEDNFISSLKDKSLCFFKELQIEENELFFRSDNYWA